MNQTVASFWTLALLLGTEPAFPAQTGPAIPRPAIYDRATNTFAQADFFKPASTNGQELIFQLAPLILQESGGGEPDRFGSWLLSETKPAIDTNRPAVYFETDSVTINGKAHARLAYLWFYSVMGPGSSDAPLRQQGVRLTLNSSGEPVIWEALADSSGLQILFVAHSLEVAAQAEFGAPLPGRRFAIERRLEDAPRGVVSRIIDDGPLPMGPMVYLEGQTRSMSTLLCRCMPVQAKSLSRAWFFELQAPSSALLDWLTTQDQSTGPPRPGLWPGDPVGKPLLERYLRLPSSF